MTNWLQLFRLKIKYIKQYLKLLDNLKEEELRREIQNENVRSLIVILTSDSPWMTFLKH